MTNSFNVRQLFLSIYREVEKATTMDSIGVNEAPGMMRQLLHLPWSQLVNGLQKYSLRSSPKCNA